MEWPAENNDNNNESGELKEQGGVVKVNVLLQAGSGLSGDSTWSWIALDSPRSSIEAEV